VDLGLSLDHWEVLKNNTIKWGYILKTNICNNCYGSNCVVRIQGKCNYYMF
jgi:hypothetical protein